MKISVVLAATSTGLLAACAPKPPASVPEIESLATTRQVMLGLTIPTSDVIFQVGGSPPADDAGLGSRRSQRRNAGRVRQYAVDGPRDLKQPEWAQHARDLVARSRAAADAAANATSTRCWKPAMVFMKFAMPAMPGSCLRGRPNRRAPPRNPRYFSVKVHPKPGRGISPVSTQLKPEVCDA